jgi:hypothetical protein
MADQDHGLDEERALAIWHALFHPEPNADDERATVTRIRAEIAKPIALAWKRNRQLAKERRAARTGPSVVALTRDAVIAKLLAWGGARGSLQFAHRHALDTMSDETLRSLLADIEEIDAATRETDPS